MAQHDFDIANQSAPNFRADLNDALEALVTQSSGSTAPSTTYANMMWYDTTNDILKMRNEADDAWINIGTLNQTLGVFEVANLPTLSEATWEAGTGTTEALVTPSKIKAAIEANIPGWTLVSSSSTWSGGSQTVTGLGGYNEVLVVGDQLTANISGSRQLRAGPSGGVLTTSVYLRPSGGDTTSARLSDNSTNGRSFSVLIHGFNSTLALKPVTSSGMQGGVENQPVGIRDASAFDRIQVFNSAGSVTGGTLYVFGR